MKATERSALVWLAAGILFSLAGLLAPMACSSTPPNVGAVCAADAGGCDNGLHCDTTADGGYCTTGCSTQGSTSECPEQAICDSFAGGPMECFRICTVQSDCRADQECNGLTGSSIKACKPK
jgi:hypothetical protein